MLGICKEKKVFLEALLSRRPMFALVLPGGHSSTANAEFLAFCVTSW